jgi:Saxitoxin biosynthesis operon protein SxtJ
MIEINFHPPKRDLKIFAVLLIAFFSLVAGWLYFKHDLPTTAVIVFVAALVLGTVCYVSPTVSRIVYVGWMIAVFPIGWVVSHVILAVAFYGIFTPFGLVMQFFGRDPMQRRIDPATTTYWIRRPEPPQSEQYFRQF